MSKLTQIENALASIDPAGFQRLCDAYLHARGHDRVNPIGLVLGTDKVKRGTPDTLIPLSDGNYVLAEYTTQTSGVAMKLLDDMEKCFDEAKTGIPVQRIREFIGCHTSVLSPADEHMLIEAGRARGCIVTLFGVGPLSHDLLQRYPGLARDHLGVEVDTGQIVSLDEFVASYGKNALATPLDTTIQFRDDDIARGVAALESRNLLTISGRPGVGKSRLALECCRRFLDKDPAFTVKAIRYRGADLFEDVRVYFSVPGSYLVFVDDANRVSGFDYILQLLNEQREDRQLKVVATVRDYALDTLLTATRPFGGGTVVTVTDLKDDEIQTIVRLNAGITNHLYLERIADIAHGNPRIALMAARVATREGSLASLADVSSLYDEYFRSVRQDLAALNDAELVRAAGALTLFRKIDQKNEEQRRVLVAAFGFDPDRLWSAIRRLHEIEIVDLYEDEVARVSDQVLATFLFHLAFFQDRVLDPAALLHPSVFPTYRSRIFDALNPVVTAFDGPAIGQRLLPIVQRRWQELEIDPDPAGLMNLVDAFGPLDPTATLAFVRSRVASLDTEAVEDSQVVFKANAAERPSLWTILGGFRDSEPSLMRMALELAAELVAKRPSEMPQALSLFTERFGIRHTSYVHEFQAQQAVIEVLWGRVRPKDKVGVEPTFLPLFLAVAEPLLHTHFDTHESKSELTITVRRFDVPATPELKKLRTTIWKHVVDLLADDNTRSSALDFIRRHSDGGYQITNPELIAADAGVVLPAFHASLNQMDYSHCAVVQSYLRLAKERHVDLGTEGAELHSAFAGRIYRLAALLVEDFDDMEERAEMGWQEYHKQRSERLAAYVEHFTASDFDALIADCLVISDDVRGRREPDSHPLVQQSRDDFQLKMGVSQLFEAIARRDPVLFREVTRAYLSRGNPLAVQPHGIVVALVTALDAEGVNGG